MTITLHDIAAAKTRIAERVSETPCLYSRTLSRVTGAEIYIKFENLQFTASFKERGALNCLLQLDAGQRQRGVSAMSAGNHGQGVAYHAHELGIPAVVVMPRNTPFVKVEHTKGHGADVILCGDNLAEAAAHAEEVTVKRGLTFIHPYDNPAVIAGQGTVALEMLKAVSDLEMLIVPVGGGGLISGMATAAKALAPGIKIIGVQSAGFPSMVAALKGDELRSHSDTIAEGIAVKTAGKITREIVRALVDDIVLVNEDQLERAIALFLNVEKTVAEGAGAAGLAAVLATPGRFRGRKIGVVLSGGNIDSRLVASVIMRELVREKRIVTLRVAISDQPGVLSRISSIVGESGGNILEVFHRRLALSVPAKSTYLELSFEARDGRHAESIIAAVTTAGFAPTIVPP